MKQIADETRQRIEEGLRNWDDQNSVSRRIFDASQQKWDEVLKPLKDAIAESERITERDLNIRITQ